MHAGAQCGDECLHLVVLQDLVDAGLLDVEDLAADRQDRLGAGITTLTSASTRGVALDDEDLALLGLPAGAVDELAGHAGATEEALAVAGKIAGFAGRDARRGGVDRLARDLLALGGILLEPGAELIVDDLLDEGLHLGVAELSLGLSLELRLAELDAHDGSEPLAHIFTSEVGVLVLEDAPLASELVDQCGECRAVALFVGATLGRVDRVGEGVDRLGEAGAPLHSDLCLQALGIVLRGKLDDRGVAHALGGVEMSDEVGDAALVVVGDFGDALGFLAAELLDQARAPALVDEGDGEAAVEERHLLESAREGRRVVPGRLEDVRVRPEGDRGAVLVGLVAPLQWGHRDAVLIALSPDVAVALHLDLEPSRQRVDDGDADAMEAAGHGVATASELAAGVKDGEDNLERGLLLHGVLIDRDAAAVVGDADAAVLAQDHRDVAGVARHCLVYGVIDNLVDQVVQSPLAGGADVHAGALADGVEPLKDGDRAGVVGHGRRASFKGTDQREPARMREND